MPNFPKLGLFSPGEEPRRSTGGASVGTMDTNISSCPDDTRSTSRYNIEEVYSRRKAKNLLPSVRQEQ